MESIKNTTTKGSPKVNVPVAIRFNAGEESIEDVKYSETSSSSLSHNDDSSWRKDFLQGGFFNRKRSGSIEGSPNISAAATAAPNVTDAHVGTWKVIKGKVSQAIEDIKSSKHDSHYQTTITTTSKPMASTSTPTHNNRSSDHDSDADSTTINSSISDDFNTDSSPIAAATGFNQKYSQRFNNSDSESDVDDLLIMCQETDPVILKKSYENIRNRTVATTAAKLSKKDSLISKLNRTKDGWSISGKSHALLRRRKKEPRTDFDADDDCTDDRAKREQIEIESGIEITEEMQIDLEQKVQIDHAFDDRNILRKSTDDSTEDSSGLSSGSIVTFTKAKEFIDQVTIMPNITTTTTAVATATIQSTVATGTTSTPTITNSHPQNIYMAIFHDIYKKKSILFSICAIFLCAIISIPAFIQGILCCLTAITIISVIQETIVQQINKKITENVSNGRVKCLPERNPFQIASADFYKTMEMYPIIPIVEEHTQLKSYSGWMNEIINYDPANYHTSMTRSVFIKLDGSMLRISNTNARIPKRAMWNEPIINRKNITFTCHRCYDLLGCRIEMCPRGLARKRYFSRKYPIQLTIKTSLGQSVQQQNISISTNSNDISDDMDFVSTILSSDLQKLHETSDGTKSFKEPSVPCGDDVRILLFARSDREKEDWYRRFKASSIGAVAEQELHIPDMVIISQQDIAAALNDMTRDSPESDEKTNRSGSPQHTNDTSKNDAPETSKDSETRKSRSNSLFEGLLMTSCASRCPADYIKFMSSYQNRRDIKHEDELWKGIDQSLYLGPSTSILWANVLIGRILFSCLNDDLLLVKIQDLLQKKLSAIKLPSFMEEVIIAQVNLGDTPPLIHRVSQPMLDERGTWIDADVTYEGLMHMTITTKLNLLRLKRQQQNNSTAATGSGGSHLNTNVTGGIGNSGSGCDPTILTAATSFPKEKSGEAIYDSNAESSGASSSESESTSLPNADHISEQQQSFYGSQGSSKKFLRIVDRITASNLFQSATEIPYIQKAMENMSTKIRLRVDLKGLIARCAINIPTPPTDRIWIGFRGPPRLWISATPAVGDHTFDWSIVTNAIESKLCEEVTKYLVYPNMVDIILPFLGQSTYRE